jgi:hypothetical protein
MSATRGGILSPLVIDHFWSSFKRNGACLIWRKAQTVKGYGVITIESNRYYVHRLSFFYTKCYLDPYRLICHICDERLCGEPNHLFHGTAKDNTEDAVRKGSVDFRFLQYLGAESKRNVRGLWRS